MTPDQQAATKQDVINLENRLVQVESRLNERMVETENRVIEAMRDMQTEIIRGLERFARGNFNRLHRLETSDNDLNERINALEERVLTLETRLPPLR